MTVIVEIIVPIFGIVLVAYLAARIGVFPVAAGRGLSLFAFSFAIPPMMFRAVATTELPSPIEWGYLLSYYGGGAAVWVLAMAISAGAFRRDLVAASLAGMTAAFSNTVMLGIPIVLTTFGEVASLPLFLLIAFHSPLLMTSITVLGETGRGRRGEFGPIAWQIVRGLITNPPVVGMALGILWNLLALPIPWPVDPVIEALSQAALPAALFALGASLAGYKIAGALPEAAAGVVLKLILHPLLVWLLGTYVFALDPLWRDVAVIMAALPVGVNVYLFAQRYETGGPPVVSAILVSTLLSVGSIAAILALLGVR